METKTRINGKIYIFRSYYFRKKLYTLLREPGAFFFTINGHSCNNYDWWDNCIDEEDTANQQRCRRTIERYFANR